MEEGEKWSKYLASRVRKGRAELGKIKTREGKWVAGTREILEETTKFYEELYKGEGGSGKGVEKWVADLGGRVAEEDREGLEREITGGGRGLLKRDGGRN